MKRRQYAILLALFFSLLPYFDVFALAIVGLVTLRKGAREGFLVLVCVSLPTWGALLIQQHALINLDNFGLPGFFVWGAAILLRQGFSWSALFKINCLISGIVLVGLHFYFGESQLQQYWVKLFVTNLKELS